MRETVRGSFKEFIKEFWDEVPGAGKLVWNWHLDILASELQATAERVFAGQPKAYDLVINISPGTSKSTLASVLFPPWTWTRMPEARHLCASHTTELVVDLAYKSRAVVRSDKYKSLFPEIELREDKEGVTLYRNTAGGDRLACTVGGKTPMGFHGHFLSGDDLIDPLKMLSDVERQTASDFLLNTLPTRKTNKSISVTILINQRLGLGDPTDVMMEASRREGGDPVRLICLPAELEVDENGKAIPDNTSPPELAEKYIDGLMDPVRLPRSVLTGYRSRNIYAYAAQFLQKPSPPGGGMFRLEYFNKRVRSSPFNVKKRIRYWDRASSLSAGACATAGVLMSVDRDGNYYIEDMVHGRWEPTERNRIMRATALRDRAKYGPKNEPTIYVEREGGSSGRDAWKGVAKALAGFRVKEDSPTGSKDTRAEPFSCQCAALNVYLVDNGESEGNGRLPEWDINSYLHELVHFRPEPGKRLGRNKDMTDSSSGAFNILSGGVNSPTLRSLGIGKSKNQIPRIVVCSRDELSAVDVDRHHLCILVRFVDPGTLEEEFLDIPETSLSFRCVTQLVLPFADVEAADFQDRWDDLVQPWGLKPEELIMNADQGKRFWAALLKKRDPVADVFVLCDDGDRRAFSAAQGICDALRLERTQSIFLIKDPDFSVDILKGASPNQHVYEMTKSCRARVV